MRSKTILQHIIFLLLILIALPGTVPAYGEGSSFDVTIGEYLSAGTGRLPFWLQANRWGLYSDSALQSATALETNYRRSWDNGFGAYLQGDLDIFVDDAGAEPRLRFGYGELSWHAATLRAGVVPQLIGMIPHPELSSGSLSVSGNARPLPRVQASLSEFVSIPFTRDTLSIKGGIAHGWYTGDRVQGNELLHEKWGYLRIGQPNSFGVYGGLVHHATWGGDAMDVTLDNFRRVFLASGGGADNIEQFDSAIGGAIGNNRGIWELGFGMPLDGYRVDGYFQKPFEQPNDIKWRNGDDGLYGIALELEHQGRWPRLLVFEHVRTMYQSGPHHTFKELYRDNEADFGVDFDNFANPGNIATHNGRSNYYSHNVYANGWTHQDRIIGTPFFVATGTGADLRIASNRIQASSLGWAGRLSSRMSYTGRFSFVYHASTIRSGAPRYAPESIVPEGEGFVQWHLLMGIAFEQAFGRDELNLEIELGADYGDVYDDAVGVNLALRWRIL